MSYKDALNDVIFNFVHEVVESKILSDDSKYNEWFIECELRKENLKKSLTSHQQNMIFDSLTNSYSDLYNIDFSYMAVQGTIFCIKSGYIIVENNMDIVDIADMKTFHNSKKCLTLINNIRTMKQIFEKLLDDKIRSEYRALDSEYIRGYMYWIRQSFIYAGKIIHEMNLY